MFVSDLRYFLGCFFNKIMMVLALAGYAIAVANLALCASLAIYHPISNAVVEYLLSIVTFMESSATPTRFCASHLYRPSSLSVTSVRIKFDFPSSTRSVPLLYQESCGLGEPSFISQVRLTLSPSSTVRFGPNNWTSGRTKYRIGKI